MLDGEYEWLSAVVANLADDNTKLVYADWLDEHGDADRAAFLRALVEAAKTMDSDQFPNIPAGVSVEWVELVGYRLLGVLAVNGNAELKKPWLKLARPALRMQKQPAKNEKFAVGASKIGGMPDLPKGYAWPKGKECRAIYNDDTEGVEELAGFLAQVNFAEIAHTQATRDLPKAGLLSFFSFQDGENDNPDVIGVKAVFLPNPTGFIRTKPPRELTAGNTEMPEERLLLAETLDVPDADSPWATDLALDSEADTGDASDHIRDLNFDNMLGYGRATSGDDPTPDKKHRHLIVLENSSGCTLHLQIHEKDLAALNFDEIKLVWVDFD